MTSLQTFFYELFGITLHPVAEGVLSIAILIIVIVIMVKTISYGANQEFPAGWDKREDL